VSTKDHNKLVQALLDAIKESRPKKTQEIRRRRRRQFSIERHHATEPR
jgi:hypothetical protein